MKKLIFNQLSMLVMVTFLIQGTASAHEITFCGELVPTSRSFVANKLMSTIRGQIPTATLTTLRYKAKYYFPYIEAWLSKYNLPKDFKYIPIVECGFQNLVSRAGARGFWQIMPEVAQKFNMVMTATFDERDIPVKSTIVACQLIREHYNYLRSHTGISSWILTAAAYNFGPGNIEKTVKKQGSDYFSMSLNPETSQYVYRLIAIKELFEHPELYMNGFGSNIFGTPVDAGQEPLPSMEKADKGLEHLARGATIIQADEELNNIEVHVSYNGERLDTKTRTDYVVAHITDPKEKFHDGGVVKLILDLDLHLTSGGKKKGGALNGHGWLIDGRVLLDMQDPDIEVFDKNMVKGLLPEDVIMGGETVILRVTREVGN